MIKHAFSVSATLCGVMAAQVLLAMPALANPADTPGQPCTDLNLISFRDPKPALVCAPIDASVPGGGMAWAELPPMQVAAIPTIGDPCNLPGGTTAMGADPTTGAPYLVMCYKDAWTRYSQ